MPAAGADGNRGRRLMRVEAELSPIRGGLALAERGCLYFRLLQPRL